MRARRRSFEALLAIVVAMSAIGGAPAHARTVCAQDAHTGGEWPTMGHDVAQSRNQPDEHVIGRTQAPLLAPAWTFSVDDATGTAFNEVTGYPIVTDGCVFVGSNSGRDAPGWVFALNADGGDLVWKTPIPDGIYGTLAVDSGVIYAYVSHVGAPYVVALDEQTGDILWRTVVDLQPGSDAVATPIVYDGMVWVGVSGTAAEASSTERFDFRGASVLLQGGAQCSNADFIDHSFNVDLTTTCAHPVAGATGGSILAREYSIPDAAWDHGNGDAGGSIWSTLSVDDDPRSAVRGFGFVGSGNPFNYNNENPHTNAVLKIDLRRTVDGQPNPDLGQIVGSYKGDVEEYYPALSQNYSCNENDVPGFFLAGFECGRLDLDFGAAPNIFRDSSGRELVGAGQKSGVYHVFDPVDMKPVWKQIVGVPSAVGGVVGTAAYDGSSLFVPHSLAGYLVSLDRGSGQPHWISPTADVVHWGNPVTSANGVIYTVDLKGFLDAFDAATGAPLLSRPMWLGANTGLAPTLSWGGVSVARNTVYASVGVGLTSAESGVPAMPDGFVIAYRPIRTL